MKPELPEVRQASLSQDDVDDLFRDISKLVVIQSVRRRGITDREETVVSLEDARELLRSSGADAVQLRYAHDGNDWIDTLVCEEECVQLTRIAVTA